MKKMFFLIVTLFTVLATNAQSSKCSYSVYDQFISGYRTGEMIYHNTCGEPIKIAIAYKVHDSKWNFQYITAGYSMLDPATKESPRRIRLSIRFDGDKLELVDWVDCAREDCDKFIKRYK